MLRAIYGAALDEGRRSKLGWELIFIFLIFSLSEMNARVYGRQLQVPRRASCLTCQGSRADLGTLLGLQDSHGSHSAKSGLIVLHNYTTLGLNL